MYECMYELEYCNLFVCMITIHQEDLSLTETHRQAAVEELLPVQREYVIRQSSNTHNGDLE